VNAKWLGDLQEQKKPMRSVCVLQIEPTKQEKGRIVRLCPFFRKIKVSRWFHGKKLANH